MGLILQCFIEHLNVWHCVGCGFSLVSRPVSVPGISVEPLKASALFSLHVSPNTSF